MPIIGIYVEKCTRCRQCIKDCPTQNFSVEDKQEQIVFDGTRCISCGHCIAVCPENAILYDDMNDETLEFKRSQDEIISYKSLHQFLRVKRSVRQYQPNKLPKEILDKVIDSMRYAPAGANMRFFK